MVVWLVTECLCSLNIKKLLFFFHVIQHNMECLSLHKCIHFRWYLTVVWAIIVVVDGVI